MNGIDKITERITLDAKAESDRILAAADEKCAAITARAEAEAAAVYDRLVKQGALAADHRAERLVSVAEREAKKQLLAEKQAIIGETFEAAAAKILSLPEDEYAAFLASLAAKSSSTGSEEIILSPTDREKLGEKVTAAANAALAKAGKPAALTLSPVSRQISGGVILKNGDVEMNASVEVLISLYKTKLTGEVAKILFN